MSSKNGVVERCSVHHWEPLFITPTSPEGQRQHLALRHADYLHCVHCGAIGQRDNTSASRVLTLSQSFTESKKREAALWNETHTTASPSSNS